MDIDYTVGEVELSYKPKFKNIYKVVSSEDAYKYLLPTYEEGTICYKEYFKVLFLNQAKQVLGYTLISEGGITETCADVRVILQAALLTNSVAIILAHIEKTQKNLKYNSISRNYGNTLKPKDGGLHL